MTADVTLPMIVFQVRLSTRPLTTPERIRSFQISASLDDLGAWPSRGRSLGDVLRQLVDTLPTYSSDRVVSLHIFSISHAPAGSLVPDALYRFDLVKLEDDCGASRNAIDALLRDKTPIGIWTQQAYIEALRSHCHGCGAPMMLPSLPAEQECTTCGRVRPMVTVREEPGEEPKEPVGHCNHGIAFDRLAAADLSVAEIRKRWPRLFGKCPKGCGYDGIYYASSEHYTMGDW